MVALDDWSELITIDYIGGLSGEFFGLLLHDAIYGDTDYDDYSDPKTNRFDFKKYDIFCDITSKDFALKNGLKKISYFRKKILKIGDNTYDDYMLNDFHNKIFKEKLSFSENLKRYVYKNHKHKFDGNLKIALFHDDISHMMPNECLPDIFPKSKNIKLICPDHYRYFADFLVIVKVINIAGRNDKSTNLLLKELLKLPSKNIYSYNNSYPCLNIDVFSLLYEEKNYDIKLSNLLKKDIILNKEKIKKYSQKNIDLLKNYGLDIYNVYNRDHFEKKIHLFLKDYLYEQLKKAAEKKDFIESTEAMNNLKIIN